jgi:DNA-binding response OmpR family regulator
MMQNISEPRVHPRRDPTLAKKTVLVADDEPTLRDLTAFMLTDAGYEVAQAADGVLALEAIKHQRPDLLLLDIMMPKLDGWGVLERLRDLPDPPPVVMVTGMYEVVPPGHLGPCVAGYVIKPFSREQLVTTCRAALAAAPAAPATGSRREPRRTFVVERGQLTQVSPHGFRLELAIPVQEGDPLRVTFRLPGREDPLELRGLVRWRSDVTIGAEINDLSARDEALLRELIEG